MHFDVVLSVFIHPCTKKVERSIQYSRRVDVAVCVLLCATMCYIKLFICIFLLNFLFIKNIRSLKNIHIKILKDRTLLQFTFTF